MHLVCRFWLSLHQQNHTTRFWKCNSSLLTNAAACNNIRQWLEQYRQDNATSPVTPAVIWDAAKAVIKGHLISYTSIRKKSITERTERLKKDLTYLEQLRKQSPKEMNMKKLNIVRNSLNLLKKIIKKTLLFC